MGISRRGKKGLFTHTMRTPKRYAPVEPRAIIRTALHTSDTAKALEKAARVEELLVSHWEALRAGKGDDAARYWEAMREVAEARGFAYLPASELAARPAPEILDRIEHVEARADAGALLGSAARPRLLLSALFERYETLTADRHRRKSEDQLRRWRAPRQKAVRNFLEHGGGDMALEDVAREHVHRLRAWWWERIKAGEVTAASANKDLAYLSAMTSTVMKMDGLRIDNPFKGLSFEQQEPDKHPFSSEWIETKLLAPDAFDGLNPEARDVLLVMVNTGCRPSEIIGLLPEHIHLKASVPHVEVREAGREIKTGYSKRDMPLVGVSLEAMRRHPDGFPRYRGKAGWSNLVTKFLRGHGLLESDKHSAYSLRHSFNDRLVNAGCEDRIRKELMGHRPEKISYGKGASLETRADWVGRVALRARS